MCTTSVPGPVSWGQVIRDYRGYTLEMTAFGVDVVMPGGGMYLATKVSLRDAMRVIRAHRRFTESKAT